jgi:glyoxylase-like metal-dependent hydrolase (beta-lactamase superfamily II)
MTTTRMPAVTADAMPAQPPAVHHPPLQIAPETFLIQQLHGEGMAPVSVNVNSLVIRGAEPVIVDTGTPNNREQWLTDVFSLVDPLDVRWIFLSHDDVDHYGNLAQVLEACPNAVFVTSFFIGERMGVLLDNPLPRSRWINDGDVLDVGDRLLVAARPPVYDNPTTRGLFDASTGVYWASDAFATPVPNYVEDVNDLDPGFWADGFAQFQGMLSPWLSIVDSERWYAQDVAKLVDDPDLRVITGAHTPPITGAKVGEALDLMTRMPTMGPVRLPEQADLDGMLAAMNAKVA